MNDLQRYFENNSKRLIDKWMHYFDIYDLYFSRYRGTDVHFVEVGIYHGGSLQMWKDYFGPKATIYGVDIDPRCKSFEEDRIRIFTGDQADKGFLRGLISEIPRMDILLDDGGHKMDQQINTFEELYPHVAADGIYLCEDMHCSYWKSHNGGYRRRGTFVEYTKHFADYLHAWHSKEVEKLGVSDFADSTLAVHYYDSVIVLEKKAKQRPERKLSGQPALPADPPRTFLQMASGRLRYLTMNRLKELRRMFTYKPYHRRPR